MSQFTRPTFDVEDDQELERLQQEFFANQQTPSAKVFRRGDPPQTKVTTAPNVESSKDTTMPTLEDVPEDDMYEPVIDPNPEPHVPVTKKMLDLTSLLGQVLGEIQEQKVEKVSAPSLPVLDKGKPARGQKDGFPKPVHRSEFKKRLEASRAKSQSPRPEAPPTVKASPNDSLMMDNDERLNQMSEQELEDARAEIMNTLSPESIAILMKGLKKSGNKTVPEPVPEPVSEPVSEPEPKPEIKKTVSKESDDLLEMKKQYFADVPLESDKLAWIDERFGKTAVQEEDKEDASEIEKVYRKIRFDLQGNICNGQSIPVHKGLHHHGDEPEKAGYTLAELFYLMRSQVPSQRGLVLTIVARILIKAKAKQTETWCKVLRVFTGKEHAAVVYLRSALDDRHLVVLVSAVRALAALVLDLEEDWEQSVMDTHCFEFMGHLTHPVLPQGSVQKERKGLNDKLTELVDRVHQRTTPDQGWRDDAELAEQDLVRALIKMDLLPRLRYLLAPDSELLEDRTSVELLVRLVIRLAEAGEDVCDLIEEEELIEPIFSWGVVKTQWPMTESEGNYPSLAAVRLLTVLAQGSKAIAEVSVDRMTSMLALLVTDPEIAVEGLKQRAYGLQLETLKLLHVLTCYGYIAPILETLQEPVMDWLRTVLEKEQKKMRTTRACTAIGLLEVLLHAAADPHKTVPEHAIDWHQPTAYLPAITAILKHTSEGTLYEAALGYLGVWARYIDLFTPEQETVHQVWKVVVQESDYFKSGYPVASSYTTHHVLRYIQFISAYASLAHSSYNQLAQSANKRLISAEGLIKEYYSKGLFGRYALSLWLKHCQELAMQWSMAELESGIKSLHMGITETWLAQDLLQVCLSKQVVDENMRPFYFPFENKDLLLSKSLFDYDGRQVKTFMYPQPNDDTVHSEPLEASVFIMSPIDALYHLDKSKVAQQSKEDAATVVTKTFETAKTLFSDTIDHHLAIVTLMKIFLIGDREGRNVELESDREVFWDLGNSLDQWLDHHCRMRTTLVALENAWRRSSTFIRQAQVPFYQFFQSFVAQYASVSLGHHGFARLLVYVVTQIDQVDYRHLVFSDYHDILSTLKVGVNEVPQLSEIELEHLSKAGLVLLE